MERKVTFRLFCGPFIDEDTGEEHYYNPPMDAIFAGLTPKPYLNLNIV